MARWTPCDDGKCPFISDDSHSTGMYFCRDMCVLGVDDDCDDYEPDDSHLEEGCDPYSGCYTDDC